jgi:hypothetical protein
LQIWKDYQYKVMANGSIPIPPIWGKDHNPNQWWNINDYEVICAAYCHETKGFLKAFLPYLLKGEIEPTTPERKIDLHPSVSGPLRLKNQRA